MTRLIACDWDAREARCVVAECRRGQLRLLAAGAAAISGGERERPGHEQVGAALREALGGANPARATVLVAVDRGAVELAQLTLPPARDDELPELVRNLALHEAHLADDDAVVDFVAQDPSGTGQRQVLAAALPRSSGRRIEAICAAAGLEPDRLVLRPYATVSLLVSQLRPSEASVLVVSPLRDEADLAVWSAGQVVFWRTVRLPPQLRGATRSQALAAEVARTLAVEAQARPDAPPVERIFILGRPADQESLVQELEESLHLSATAVEPWAAAGQPATDLGDDPPPVAALLGMLLDEAQGRTPAVDFLHPRRAPRPRSRRPLAVLAAAAAVLLAGWIGSRAWNALDAADQENARLAKRLAGLDLQLKQAQGERELVQALHQWEQGSVVWLDELRELSLRLPGERDAVVSRLAMNRANSGGVVELSGVVRDAAIVGRMEHQLRDEFHEVHSHRVQERHTQRSYDWQFESSIFVAPRDRDSYRARPAAELSATRPPGGPP